LPATQHVYAPARTYTLRVTATTATGSTTYTQDFTFP